MRIGIVVLVLVALRANADPPSVITHPEADPVWQLCRFWKSDGKRPAVTAELKKRADFTAEEWKAIEAGQIYIGMRDVPMICSVGFFETINRTVTKYGTTEQYVFRGGVYVYVENGKVTSWQD